MDEKVGAAQFKLGRFDQLARFFSSSRAAQHFPSAAPEVDAVSIVMSTPSDAAARALPATAPVDAAA
jgi:hypothetical protein